MKQADAILLLGPTGSGKTPLGEALERQSLWGRACRHFDFGRQLRDIAAGTSTPASLSADDVQFIRNVLRRGALLEDEHFAIAEGILRAFLAGARGDEYTVLNGLPRHLGQARDMGRLVAVRAVVELACTPRAVLDRIRTDAGGDRTGRCDDSPDDVRVKLDLYARRTAPLADYYRAGGARIERIEVDATTSADDLAELLNARA